MAHLPARNQLVHRHPGLGATPRNSREHSDPRTNLHSTGTCHPNPAAGITAVPVPIPLSIPISVAGIAAVLLLPTRRATSNPSQLCHGPIQSIRLRRPQRAEVAEPSGAALPSAAGRLVRSDAAHWAGPADDHPQNQSVLRVKVSDWRCQDPGGCVCGDPASSAPLMPLAN